MIRRDINTAITCSAQQLELSRSGEACSDGELFRYMQGKEKGEMDDDLRADRTSAYLMNCEHGTLSSARAGLEMKGRRNPEGGSCLKVP